MTQIYSFYRVSDGTFTGDTYAGQDPASAAPHGCLAMPGRFNPSAQRVELKTGQVVEWRAPPPDSDTLRTWVWHEQFRRWVEAPTLEGLKAQRLAVIQTAIDSQEAAQARPVRELLAAMLAGGQPGQAAKDRLMAVSEQIALLQAKRAAVEAATTEQALREIPP